MGCDYVFHHPPEGLYILYVDLALPPFCVDDDPSCIVGFVPRFDQNVDLSLITGNAPRIEAFGVTQNSVESWSAIKRAIKRS